ncbi:MAG: hypothetical protein UX89_C0005G0007 [Parcubacteria group bacterium GW2011_GWA2_47_16]|nr:MAG: hypothetical protein UX89_C0005G0007 [Parcubacteria group bacterium GW2011_GWA2_47_16]
MSLNIQLARHFTAKDIKEAPVPNGFRHLHFPDAAAQARKMRAIVAGLDNITLLGHSEAIRARYSLELSTIGIVDNVQPVQIPNIFLPTDEADLALVMSACKVSLNPSTWTPEQQEALKHFGKIGAESIRKALEDAGVTEGTALIFTHGPMINSLAAYLAGGDEGLVESLFRIDTKEGDRFEIGMDGSVYPVHHHPLVPVQ